MNEVVFATYLSQHGKSKHSTIASTTDRSLIDSKIVITLCRIFKACLRRLIEWCGDVDHQYGEIKPFDLWPNTEKPHLDAVDALLIWHSQSNIKSGYIFRRITLDDQISESDKPLVSLSKDSFSLSFPVPTVGSSRVRFPFYYSLRSFHIDFFNQCRQSLFIPLLRGRLSHFVFSFLRPASAFLRLTFS